MSKTTRMFGKGIATMFFLFIASNNVWAGDTAYRDCEVKVNSPSSAQGLVYVDDYFNRDKKAHNYISPGPCQNAVIKSNFGSKLSHFHCILYAFPKPGYAIAGFVTKDDYLAGRKSNFIDKKAGTWLSFGETITDSEKPEKDPIESPSYSFLPKTRVEYYAIFKPSIRKTVTVQSPGNLKYALSQISGGDTCDDLKVIGPIWDDDFAYLRDLINNKNLTRLDLSQAKFSILPARAFSDCHSLYEIKLPTNGLKEIGNSAFYSCRNLKKVTIPSSVTKRGDNIFDDCYCIEKGF